MTIFDLNAWVVLNMWIDGIKLELFVIILNFFWVEKLIFNALFYHVSV